jgi:hypothetical protein
MQDLDKVEPAVQEAQQGYFSYLFLVFRTFSFLSSGEID